MARVSISPAAREDLRDIRRYTKDSFGPEAAHGYLEGLRSVFRLLLDQPRAGAVEPELGEGLRGFGYRAHRVYDRIDPDGVRIIRILHGARDRRTAFGPDK